MSPSAYLEANPNDPDDNDPSGPATDDPGREPRPETVTRDEAVDGATPAVISVISEDDVEELAEDLLEEEAEPLSGELAENEDLPNTPNPDDWARISGKKGERITYIRTIIQGKKGAEPGRSIDTVNGTGQYL